MLNFFIMSFKRKNLGKSGEESAKKYLINKGYKIIDTNYRSRFGEVDLIAQNGDFIVLVEVKTKEVFEQGNPEEMVNIHKQKKLKLLSREIEQKYPDKNIRIDVIAIDASLPNPKINHIINAVEG